VGEVAASLSGSSAHPSLSALWFGGRASAPVVQSVHYRNHTLAMRLHALATRHHDP
jgi:hypothetical protein